MIEITSDAIERVGTLLADVPKGAERVFASAMNRGISRVKTQAIKQVKTVYAVNGAALTKATRINITQASTGKAMVTQEYLRGQGASVFRLKRKWDYQQHRWWEMKIL